MDQHGMTPSEVVAGQPALAQAALAPVNAAARWQRAWRTVPVVAGIAAIGLAGYALDPESDLMGWVMSAGIVLFLLGMWLLKSGPAAIATSPAVVRIATALLALEAAGAIALRRDGRTMLADPLRGDGPPPFPALSLEATLLRGRPLPVGEIVEGWLGDRSNEPDRRAAAIQAMLGAERRSGADDTPSAAGAAEAEALTALFAAASDRGLVAPLIAVIKAGLAAATVPVQQQAMPQGSVPVYYNEAAVTELLADHQPAADPAADLPDQRRRLHAAVAAVADDTRAAVDMTRDRRQAARGSAEGGCLFQLVVLVLGGGWMIASDGLIPRFVHTAPWVAVGTALAALAGGTLARRRRQLWEDRGYLAYEDPPEPSLFGSWAAVGPNGHNHTTPLQDLFTGAVSGLTIALLYAYAPIWLFGIGCVLLVVLLSQPWRSTALSPAARQRLIGANLGAPVEAGPDAAPPELDPAPAATESLVVRHASDLARALAPSAGGGDPLAPLRATGPHPLVLLRVFGSETYGEIVDWLRGWTKVGPVVALEGPDTVAANTALDKALETGDLAGFLIDTPGEAADTVAQWFAAGAGPWQHHTAQCTNATWRSMVEQLLDHAQLVLMDLSGFCAARQGSSWELQTLANHVPLERITLLVNTNTDLAFLAGLLATIRARLDPGSPNHGRAVDWTLVMIGGPAGRGEDESHWDWLRRADRRITPPVLCACLAHLLTASGALPPPPGD